jgi:hypothetical protein
MALLKRYSTFTHPFKMIKRMLTFFETIVESFERGEKTNLTVAIMMVLALPPNESFRSQVRTESRYGIKTGLRAVGVP